MIILKRIIISFIKDHISFTLIYILNTILLIAFFYLLNENNGEFFYPILISLIIYIFFILIKWFQYYRFHASLQNCITNVNYDLQPSSAQQQEVSRIIAAIHEKYSGEINSILVNQRHQKHFLSQWIHNMKTPVSVIDLIIQKISEENESFDKRIEDIKVENLKLLNSLEQVLNISRLEDFAKDYMPVTIDLVSSVNMVINEKKSQFIYNNVFPKFQQNIEAVYVLSDAKWNQFMLEQIVSNAIKYSTTIGQSKNIYFKISSYSDKVILTIEDEGIGIPEYDIPRIFEPFFTGENGRKYKNSTGIGLFVCKTIAEKLGHQISIQSRLGEGTTVSISYLSKM